MSTVAHRQPSITVPQKRKSAESSRSRETSPHDLHVSTQAQRLQFAQFNPSPTPSVKHDVLTGVSVVIPSPDARQQKHLNALRQAELAGVSEERYPTIAPEQKKAARRAYPKTEAVDRSVIALSAATPLAIDSVAVTTEQLRSSLARKLRGISGPVITFQIDDKKLAMLCATFEFINDYSLQSGVTPVPEEFNAGCDCGDQCDSTKCGCLTTEPDSDRTIIPYHQLESGQWVLHPMFLSRKSMIYECSFRCSCQGKCWNHVVQRGRQIRLEIFDTGARGLGML